MKYFITFVVENWYLFIIALAIIACTLIAIHNFYKLPTNKKLDKIRSWLQIAVQKAEKAIGSGNGDKKLRKVYKKFIVRFPFTASIIDYELFKHLVDEALEKVDKMLS